MKKNISYRKKIISPHRRELNRRTQAAKMARQEAAAVRDGFSSRGEAISAWEQGRAILIIAVKIEAP